MADNSTINVYYKPRQQFLAFHNRQQRWACIVFHRRGGKTVACVNDIHTRALYTPKKNARYAYIAPFYRQAKDVAWMYLKEATLDSAVKVKESELSVELFNGSKISLYGADNPDALRGIYLDGVVLDEFGDCRPALWAEVILPTLTDRRGWATFIGTPKGKNHFYQIREMARKSDEWFYLSMGASESGLLPQRELDMVKKLMTEDQYAQEYECSFEAAVQGTYYASLIDKMEKGRIDDPEADPQIGVVKWDPTLPVHVVQDLGFTDSTALWFWQHRPDGIAVIDYEEAHSESLQYYFDLLVRKPYEIDSVWLPHDSKAKTLQTGRSTIEQYLNYVKQNELDWDIKLVPKLDLQHGIDAVRFILPYCYIDQQNCNDGIEGLRAYRRKYDEITNSFSNKPQHDWSSHPSDAFRYLALVAKERIKTPGASRILSDQGFVLPTGYSLDDLFSDKEKVNWNRNRI